MNPTPEAVRAALERLDARLAPPRIKSADSHTAIVTHREPRWEWPSTARRCYWCRRKSVLMVYTVKMRPTFTYGKDGPTGTEPVLSAKCLDDDECWGYQMAQRAKRSRRQGLFILEQPAAPDARPPYCKWCGLEIVLVNPDDHRRRQRGYHRGDEHEVGNTLDCVAAYNAARTYEPRVAVFHREVTEHGRLACVDCGTVCAEPNPDVKRPSRNLWHAIELVPWECDHDQPLEDGGLHELDNLRCRCIPCHRKKTARENRERAERRAKLPDHAQRPARSPRGRRQRAPEGATASDPF